MSAAQQLRNEGREEGREKGMQSRNLAIARTMLQDQEPAEKIMRFTGLTRQQIEQLEKE